MGRLKTALILLAIIAVILTLVFSSFTHFSDDLTEAPHSYVFWNSFYTSWTQDLVFFVVIGLTLYIIAMPRSVDTLSYEERVSQLYGSGCPEVLRQWGLSRIKKYAGYSPSARRDIEILEWDETNKALRVQYTTSQIIKNILKDVRYEDYPTLSFEVHPETRKLPKKTYGGIQSISLGTHIYTDAVRDFGAEGYSESIEITIDADQEDTFKMVSWTWVREHELIELASSRVIEEFIFMVKNKTSEKFKIIPVLPNGEEHVLDFDDDTGLTKIRHIVPGDTFLSISIEKVS